MGPHTKRSVPPLEGFHITRRAEDIFSARFQLLDEKASERIGSSGAVTVHNDNFVGAGAFGASNSGVDFGGKETTSFLVDLAAAWADLFPVDDTAHAFHVTPERHPRLGDTSHERHDASPREGVFCAQGLSTLSTFWLRTFFGT